LERKKILIKATMYDSVFLIGSVSLQLTIILVKKMQ